MREIKFRAWDGKEMHSISGISWRSIFGGGEPERYVQDKITDVDFGDYEKPNWQAPYEFLPYNGYDEEWDKRIKELDEEEAKHQAYIDSIKLMQYTGLKDKNDTEIYEGDIVQSERDTMVVGWKQSAGSFCLDRDGWLSSHYFGEAVDAGNTEVIGNIYENPELLT